MEGGISEIQKRLSQQNKEINSVQKAITALETLEQRRADRHSLLKSCKMDDIHILMHHGWHQPQNCTHSSIQFISCYFMFPGIYSWTNRFVWYLASLKIKIQCLNMYRCIIYGNVLAPRIFFNLSPWNRLGCFFLFLMHLTQGCWVSPRKSNSRFQGFSFYNLEAPSPYYLTIYQ